jgi:hypothetical protein
MYTVECEKRRIVARVGDDRRGLDRGSNLGGDPGASSLGATVSRERCIPSFISSLPRSGPLAIDIGMSCPRIVNAIHACSVKPRPI